MIAIKDIEMPKSCVLCPIKYVQYCMLVKDFVEGKEIERHPKCPLVEVK